MHSSDANRRCAHRSKRAEREHSTSVTNIGFSLAKCSNGMTARLMSLPVLKVFTECAAKTSGTILMRTGSPPFEPHRIRRSVLMAKQARLAPEIECEGAAGLPPPAPFANSSSTVLALIERVALDPGADAEKLERMMAMYEALKAKEAELAYNAAKGRS
jgi:hypothetical protein